MLPEQPAHYVRVLPEGVSSAVLIGIAVKSEQAVSIKAAIIKAAILINTPARS